MVPFVRARPSFWAVLTLLLGTFWTQRASAGNDDGVLIGDQATVMGGAVTAITSNGAALWYNPAGVVQGAANTLDVSVTAYTLRLSSTSALLSSVDGAAARGDTVEFTIIPAAVTYDRRVGPNTRLAFGVFQPTSVDNTVTAMLDTNGDHPSHWEGNIRENISETHVLLGIGHRFSDRLNFGVALNAYYASIQRTGSFDGARLSDPSTFLSYAGTRSRSAMGATLSLGLQWRPHPHFVIGASLRAPGMVFFSNTRVSEFTTQSADGTAESARTDVEQTHHGGLIYPGRLRFGIAYTSPSWTISGDIDALHHLNNDDLGVRRRALYNIRLGIERRVGEHVSIGGGLFTDRPPWRGLSESLDRSVDFYGGTLGVSFETERALDTEVEEVRRLYFGTTIAIRYAYGTGQIVGARVNESFRIEDSILATVDHTEHEIGLNIAARLQF